MVREPELPSSIQIQKSGGFDSPNAGNGPDSNVSYTIVSDHTVANAATADAAIYDNFNDEATDVVKDQRKPHSNGAFNGGTFASDLNSDLYQNGHSEANNGASVVIEDGEGRLAIGGFDHEEGSHVEALGAQVDTTEDGVSTKNDIGTRDMISKVMIGQPEISERSDSSTNPSDKPDTEGKQSIVQDTGMENACNDNSVHKRVEDFAPAANNTTSNQLDVVMSVADNRSTERRDNIMEAIDAFSDSKTEATSQDNGANHTVSADADLYDNVNGDLNFVNIADDVVKDQQKLHFNSVLNGGTIAMDLNSDLYQNGQSEADDGACVCIKDGEGRLAIGSFDHEKGSHVEEFDARKESHVDSAENGLSTNDYIGTRDMISKVMIQQPDISETSDSSTNLCDNPDTEDKQSIIQETGMENNCNGNYVDKGVEDLVPAANKQLDVVMGVADNMSPQSTDNIIDAIDAFSDSNTEATYQDNGVNHTVGDVVRADDGLYDNFDGELNFKNGAGGIVKDQRKLHSNGVLSGGTIAMNLNSDLYQNGHFEADNGACVVIEDGEGRLAKGGFDHEKGRHVEELGPRKESQVDSAEDGLSTNDDVGTRVMMSKVMIGEPEIPETSNSSTNSCDKPDTEGKQDILQETGMENECNGNSVDNRVQNLAPAMNNTTNKQLGVVLSVSDNMSTQSRENIMEAIGASSDSKTEATCQDNGLSTNDDMGTRDMISKVMIGQPEISETSDSSTNPSDKPDTEGKHSILQGTDMENECHGNSVDKRVEEFEPAANNIADKQLDVVVITADNVNTQSRDNIMEAMDDSSDSNTEPTCQDNGVNLLKKGFEPVEDSGGENLPVTSKPAPENLSTVSSGDTHVAQLNVSPSKSKEQNVHNAEHTINLSIRFGSFDVGDRGKLVAGDTASDQNPSLGESMNTKYYLVKIPRNDDEDLKKQIRMAQITVHETTQRRDVIQNEIQRQKAICMDCRDSIHAAESLVRDTLGLYRSKRHEVESLQFVIDLGNIDRKIRNMENKIQHETLPLKEEKLLIREINLLKQEHKQLQSNMSKQAEVEQALNEEAKGDGRLQRLRKELDALRDDLLKAETAVKAARKKHFDESKMLDKLREEFNAANVIRQNAYKHFLSLKEQLHGRNKYFWQYRDDSKTAQSFAYKKDRKALQNLCVDQVERFMTLWNEDGEFRREYVISNTRRIGRSFRTIDGCSEGPSEEAPAHLVNERSKDMAFPALGKSPDEEVTMDSCSVRPSQEGSMTSNVVNGRRDSRDKFISAPEKKQEKQVVLGDAENSNGMHVMETTDLRSQPSKSRKLANVDAFSREDEAEEARKVEQKRTEEEEMDRKAEEKKKEEEADRLKELRRLEEQAKAREAMERKRRMAGKAQARAAAKAIKEAERREKERERKQRKKEQSKASTAAAAVDTNVEDQLEICPTEKNMIEMNHESEILDKPIKRSAKPSHFTKQTKLNSIPPPLRRRRRRMQPWIWVLIVILLLVLFVLWQFAPAWAAYV